MEPYEASATAQRLMQDFARETGLDPPAGEPKRYLWTDAFAVCNYLGFFQQSGNPAYRELAIRLIDQVHDSLGRYRTGDIRTGWISGLPPEEAEQHPTAGGLRIGKPLPERKPNETYNNEMEWDRDGQYFHYLTKWMHALTRAGRVTGDTTYLRWAVELARTAHAGFTYDSGNRMLMYWKMSTDLSRPLVPSMGQHDPLDGLVTYAGLQLEAGDHAGLQNPVGQEIADMTGIVRNLPLATDDPLGIGGLLFDSLRMARLMIRGVSFPTGLLGSVTTAALEGLGDFSRTPSLALPAGYRLAFRELGLSTGLAAAGELREVIAENSRFFRNEEHLSRRVEELCVYIPLRERIEDFWLDTQNRTATSWTGHREINTVMLATSLAPGGFLGSRD